MFNKLVCTMLVACGFLSAQVFGNAPDEFYVKERFFSLTTTFDIETKTEKLGTVYRKFLSLMPEYHLESPQEQLLAVGTMRFWSIFLTFDITDHRCMPLGSVNQRLSWFYPTFEVFSPFQQKLAEAELNFWETKWTITDPIDGHVIAVISRPFFRLKSDWTVNIYDQSSVSEYKIHPHLLLTLIAFQVDRENWEAWEDILDGDGKGISHKLLAERSTFLSQTHYLEALNQRLELDMPILKGLAPTDEDFLFVESLADEKKPMDSSLSEEARFQATADRLFSYLSSDELTQKQKAALYKMLQHRLR